MGIEAGRMYGNYRKMIRCGGMRVRWIDWRRRGVRRNRSMG